MFDLHFIILQFPLMLKLTTHNIVPTEHEFAAMLYVSETKTTHAVMVSSLK